ncbi:MAG TPA: hypothetical protein VI136_02480 [Verrucomicrobiae bacterium]
MPHLTKNEWKGLWAILWRVLVLGPIVGLFGLALLVMIIAVFLGPPAYAAFAFLSGDWLLGIVALAGWSVVLCFRRPFLRWTLEGIEHASI